MTLADRLRAARKNAGLSQKVLAENSGVTQETISKIERGQSETSAYVVQLAIACGVRPEWLAMEKGEMVDGLYVQDEDIKCAVLILEKLKAENKLDDALQILDLAFKHVKKNAA